MKRIIMILVALLIVSCSGTPQDAVAEIQKAVNNRDWPALEQLTEEKTLWPGDAQRVLELDESRGGILSALSMIDLKSVDVIRDGAIVELSAATYTYYGRERVNISMGLRKPSGCICSRNEWKLLKVDMLDYKTRNRALMDNTLLRYAIYDQVQFLNKYNLIIESGIGCGVITKHKGFGETVTLEAHVWSVEGAEGAVHESYIMGKVREREDELGRGLQESARPMSYYGSRSESITTNAPDKECLKDAAGKLIFVEQYSDSTGVNAQWVVPDIDMMMRNSKYIPWEIVKGVSDHFMKNNIYK